MERFIDRFPDQADSQYVAFWQLDNDDGAITRDNAAAFTYRSSVGEESLYRTSAFKAQQTAVRIRFDGREFKQVQIQMIADKISEARMVQK